MPKRKRDPFEVKLTPEQQKQLTIRLCEEIQGAFDARQLIVGEDQRLDYWHRIYEGGDRELTKQYPWPGAANLTSWIGTEKVDAFRARVVKTLFTEPIWIVSGWQSDPERLALVESFHQWTAEEERLQVKLSKVVHNALIEGTGVLEVSERPVVRRQRQRMMAALMTNPEGFVITDENGKPQIQTDEEGNPVPAPPGTDPALMQSVTVDNIIKVRSGPQYRVVCLKDFCILPGHAQEKEDVWGYAKRFWKRMPDLLNLQQQGVYMNVDELGEDNEREMTTELMREGQNVPDQRGASAEKELFELTYLDDLDGDGIQEWYVVTLSLKKQVLLRIQRDDLGQSRYLLFIPFPRTRFLYGYSLIGHKLETIIEEHTAWRNMIADRVNLVINAPLKRLVGSLWNPRSQPFGPGTVIDVREMNEVMPMTIPDLPSSVVHREGSVLQASERVAGMVDTAAGTHPAADRTLGEVKTVHGESLIRIEEVIKHLQEAMEDLFTVRHEIWKRTLKEQPQDVPSDLLVSMENRGFDMAQRLLTADDLEGIYRGKPRNSVETADYSVMRQDYIGLMTALTQFAQAVPMFGALFQDPELGKALISQAIRIFRWENKEAFETALKKAAQKLMQQQQLAQQMQAMGLPPPGQPGGQGSPPNRPGAGRPPKPAGRQPMGQPNNATGPGRPSGPMTPKLPGGGSR